MLNRGQTETLGFVLVFAIITASIGIVYATGFTGLNDVREFEQVNNAERAFEVMAGNIQDLTHRIAPSRSTEIKLADAQLRIADEIQIQVNDPDSSYNITYGLRPIIYDPDTGTEIVYEQGAVIRSQRDSGILVRESTLVLNENRSVIPIVHTRLSGDRQISGSSTVLLRADHSKTRLDYVNDSASNNKIWINITSPRAPVWHNHLSTSFDNVTCEDVTDDTTACQVTTDRVYVPVYQIDLSIES